MGGRPIRRTNLEAGLNDAGLSNVTLLESATGLIERIYKRDPDVILIDLENPSRDVLEQMFQISRVVRRPIAMFVDQSVKATIEVAIDVGVSAMRRIARLRDDGSFELDTVFLRDHKEKIDYESSGGSPVVGTLFSDSLSDLLGPTRQKDEVLQQKHRDLARSVQEMYEEAFFLPSTRSMRAIASTALRSPAAAP